jgi:hypothetical protein
MRLPSWDGRGWVCGSGLRLESGVFRESSLTRVSSVPTYLVDRQAELDIDRLKQFQGADSKTVQEAFGRAKGLRRTTERSRIRRGSKSQLPAPLRPPMQQQRRGPANGRRRAPGVRGCGRPPMCTGTSRPEESFLRVPPKGTIVRQFTVVTVPSTVSQQGMMRTFPRHAMSEHARPVRQSGKNLRASPRLRQSGGDSQKHPNSRELPVLRAARPPRKTAAKTNERPMRSTGQSTRFAAADSSRRRPAIPAAGSRRYESLSRR